MLGLFDVTWHCAGTYAVHGDDQATQLVLRSVLQVCLNVA